MKSYPVSSRASNIEYAIRDVVIPANKLEKQGKSIIKLNIGDPLAYPYFKTPKHMIDAYCKSLLNQNNGYSSSYGINELREAIAFDEQNKENGGWNCSLDDVYICHGVTEALQILFAAILTENDIILAPGPHYPPYMAYPQLYGAKTVEYKLDSKNNWGIDIQDLKNKIDNNVKAIVVINPNNPTGGIATKKQLIEIINIAKEIPNCIIISDEIYDKINFNNDHISLASLSKDVPVITLNGVSKVFYAPGWRIGYMAWHDPSKKLDRIRDGVERLLRSRLCASTPAQYGYLAGLNGPTNWMIDYNKKLIENRDYCIKRINSIDGLESKIPNGSFYMFIKITSKKWLNNDKNFALSLLMEKHVLVVHGSGFSEKYGKGYFRIVFLPNIEQLDIAFNRIDDFLNR